MGPPAVNAGSRCDRMRRAHGALPLALATLLVLLRAAAADGEGAPTPRLEELRRFSVPEAHQAVAVDGSHFYAISSRAIGKYDKRSGLRVASWSAAEDDPIVHLNSGIAIGGRLHCAHSNYPGIPMWSSIETFDAATLEHLESHSFGIAEGSATWIDRRHGLWWVAFAHYAGRGGTPGQGPRWTRLVTFDADWRRVRGYVFPDEVVERFGVWSTSGGGWGPEGLLYATGHDAPELYALRLPRAGSELELVRVLPAPNEGQGIAWDGAEPGTLYTVVRGTREVVVSRLVAR